MRDDVDGQHHPRPVAAQQQEGRGQRRGRQIERKWRRGRARGLTMAVRIGRGFTRVWRSWGLGLLVSESARAPNLICRSCTVISHRVPPPALSLVASRPRTANTGKSKMVSSSCCPISSYSSSMYLLLSGYRHQKAPRQEGQPHRPQERGSVLALAGQGAFVLPSLRFCVTKLNTM